MKTWADIIYWNMFNYQTDILNNETFLKCNGLFHSK